VSVVGGDRFDPVEIPFEHLFADPCVVGSSIEQCISRLVLVLQSTRTVVLTALKV
jgi:hypothetical protein